MLVNFFIMCQNVTPALACTSNKYAVFCSLIKTYKYDDTNNKIYFRVIGENTSTADINLAIILSKSANIIISDSYKYRFHNHFNI